MELNRVKCVCCCCFHIRYRTLLTTVILLAVFIYLLPLQTIRTMYSDSSLEEATLTARAEEGEVRLLKKLTMVGKAPISNNCTKEFPQCILIGVMKGGTEAFSTFLAIHPRVAMQFQLLSTRFFTNMNYHLGFEWYRDQMPCSTKDQITVEKAPQYFPTQDSPRKIHEFNSTIKLILMVRHPIDRAVSHFLQQQAANPQRLHAEIFEENVIDENGEVNPNNVYIHQSSYIYILREWLKYFKLDQILIIDGDNFKNNTIGELARAEKFLNLEPYIKKDMFQYNAERKIYCIKSSTEEEDLCLPENKGRKHPKVIPEVYAKLAAYFEPLNKEFMETVGVTFHW